MPVALPAPAFYFPLDSGRYEIKTGLHHLGTDFGHGIVDSHVFQFDDRFPQYRAAKLAGRAERLSKYYVEHRYGRTVAHAVADFLVRRLALEHPQWFVLNALSPAHTCLDCVLTGERLVFDETMALAETDARDPVPPYASSLDALACQVPEDLAVITLAGHHWLSALHLCCPNRWAAEGKIGGDFASIHRPVPGIEKISARAQALVQAMVYGGPFVRFAWGLSTHAHLNRHPQPPAGRRQEREFSCRDPRLWLRVERQVLWGLPKAGAALFIIRTYLTDCREIKGNARQLRKLCSAVGSMGQDELAYKGLAASAPQILAWLKAGTQFEERFTSCARRASSASNPRRCPSK